MTVNTPAYRLLHTSGRRTYPHPLPPADCQLPPAAPLDETTADVCADMVPVILTLVDERGSYASRRAALIRPAAAGSRNALVQLDALRKEELLAVAHTALALGVYWTLNELADR